MEILSPYLFSLIDYANCQKLNKSDYDDILSRYNLFDVNQEDMVSAKAYLEVLENIIEKSNNSHSGLCFGCYLNLEAQGLVLEISLNTSSIKQGVFILQNFLDNKFPLVSAIISEDSNEYILELRSSVNNLQLKKNLLDMVLSIIFRELKLMLPNSIVPKIRLPYDNANPYNHALKVDVSYHENYQIVLPIEVTKTEINKKKIKEIEILLPKFISLLNHKNKNKEQDFSLEVKNMTLKMCSPEIPSFEQVQMQFPYSKRSMQRKLNKEGMSYRMITNSIKEEISTYLTKEKHLKTKDVAYILGYSEASAYLHAKKSWNSKKQLV